MSPDVLADYVRTFLLMTLSVGGTQGATVASHLLYILSRSLLVVVATTTARLAHIVGILFRSVYLWQVCANACYTFFLKFPFTTSLYIHLGRLNIFVLLSISLLVM